MFNRQQNVVTLYYLKNELIVKTNDIPLDLAKLIYFFKRSVDFFNMIWLLIARDIYINI